jgi:hypothetical protein
LREDEKYNYGLGDEIRKLHATGLINFCKVQSGMD